MELIKAWVDSKERAAGSSATANANGWEPHYLLRPINIITATQREFGMYSADGRPVPRSLVVGSASLQEPDRHRFILGGSLQPWRIITTMFLERSRLMLITLEAEELPPLRARS